jgi:hypothetical protein
MNKRNSHAPESQEDLGTQDRPGPNGQATDPVAADPYDLANLTFTQDFESAIGVKTLTTTIPVRKPSKEWFIRVHPDEAYRKTLPILELKEDRGIYVVAQSLWGDLATEPTFAPRLIATAMSKQKIVFLWPLRLPGSDGRLDDWSQSALDAFEQAKSQWVRLIPDKDLNAYRIRVAEDAMEPNWPDLPFQEMIRTAFRNNMISDWDHPVLKRLRGEA